MAVASGGSCPWHTDMDVCVCVSGVGGYCLVTLLSFAWSPAYLTDRPPGKQSPYPKSHPPLSDLIHCWPDTTCHPLPLSRPLPTLQSRHPIHSTPSILSIFHSLLPTHPPPRLSSKVRWVTVSSSVIHCHSSADPAQAGGEWGRHSDEGRMPN